MPYQGNWLISDEGEKASYTNLPAGEYVFEVKNIHPNGQTGAVTSLKILILPHWSQTFAFRLFVSLLLFSIAVGKGWYQVSPRKMLAAVWGMMILAPVMMLGTGMLAEYQVKRLQAWLGYGRNCRDGTVSTFS